MKRRRYGTEIAKQILAGREQVDHLTPGELLAVVRILKIPGFDESEPYTRTELEYMIKRSLSRASS